MESGRYRKEIMAKMYENLEVWKEAIDLAVTIYSVTDNFPKEETYGLTSQLRKAAVSISSNIAEGSGRKSKKDFRQFVHIASGSLNEVESLLIVSSRLNLIDVEFFKEIKARIQKLGRLIGGLLRYLNDSK
ncbi:MAG TPA: four helix bundle protein [Thermodesulfobacteriota bacterium]|nr:four helix bundle protein [Thermodesulfobacteriota bacterium]